MSRGVLINNLDTYIGTALYEELLGENPAESLEYEIYGTYCYKESSERPLYVKKMLKMSSKPGLFRKYMLEKMDYYIYDIQKGVLTDLEFAVKALTKTPLETEKTLIVISSVLSWGGNQHNMVEDKPVPILDEDGNVIPNKENLENTPPKIKNNENSEIGISDKSANLDNVENTEQNLENLEKIENDDEFDYEYEDEILNSNEDEIFLKNNNNPISDEDNFNNDNKPKIKIKRIIKIPKKQIKLKRIGYNEEEFEKRIPCEHFTKIKEMEDSLLKLKFDNLNIYIICTGIPYGNCETTFNYFFKSAWLQNPNQLPIVKMGLNLIPTIHIKDLCKIIKKLINGAKPENKYIFAIDQTHDKSLKNIIQSISRGIGNGMTTNIEEENELEFFRNLKIKHEDYFINKELKIYSKNHIDIILTELEFTWQNFLNFDIMLNTSKFIDEEFEWHCKDGIPGNIEKIMKEFAEYRKLRPIKIILNCTNKLSRKKYAEKISNFFNIPIINYEKIVDMLSVRIKDLNEEEIHMAQKYLILIEKMNFIQNNPEFVNEENLLLCDVNEIMMECLKFLIKENACRNRGYVLEGMPVNLEEVGRLYYFKQEIVPEEGAGEEEMDEAEVEELEGINVGNEEMEANVVMEGIKEDINEEDNTEENDNNEGYEKDSQNENENYDNENLKIKENKIISDPLPILPLKKKKKIKPKKYKIHFDKTLLPESVISISLFNNDMGEVDNIFWEVENFYQENNIEILNLLSKQDLDGELENEEMFEMMRIYIERNGRPFNYFNDTDYDINFKRENFVKEKVRKYDSETELKKRKEAEIEKQKEDEFWRKMEKRIESIRIDKDEILDNDADKFPTRKFLLLNIMPILTKGMLEVCKINPIDPIDYLADFLFKNSTD